LSGWETPNIRENILFSRISSLHKHTNIREISSLSQNYFIFSKIILFSRKLFYFRKICLYTHKHTQKLFYFREKYFICVKIILFFEIHLYTHTHKHSQNIIFFAKYILFSRISSLHKHTNIREISTFSQNYFIFAKFIITNTHKYSRNIIFFCENYFVFAKFILTHTHKHSQNIIFFVKYILFSRITSLQKHTNIREISSFSRKLFNFHENYFIFAKFVFTYTHEHSRNIFFFAKFVFTHTHTFAKYRHLLLIIVKYCLGESQRISDLIIINAFKGWIFFVNYCHLL